VQSEEELKRALIVLDDLALETTSVKGGHATRAAYVEALHAAITELVQARQRIAELTVQNEAMRQVLMEKAGQCCGYEDTDGCDYCHPMRVAMRGA